MHELCLTLYSKVENRMVSSITVDFQRANIRVHCIYICFAVTQQFQK